MAAGESSASGEADSVPRREQSTLFARLTLLLFSMVILSLIAISLYVMGGISDGRGLVVGVLGLILCLGVGGFIRFRCRIGLRTFLVLVTLLSMVLAVAAKVAMRVRQVSASVRELERDGATVHFDIATGNDWFRTQSGFFLPPWTLEVFGEAAFSDVVQVDFYRAKVTKKQISRLSVSCPKVRRLAFYQAQISSGALRELGHLEHLEHIDLSNSSASGEDLSDIVGQAKQVKSIYLNGTKLTGESLAALRNLPNLESLWVNGATVSDSAVESLGPQPNMRFLVMPGGKQLTDQGVKQIARNMQNLEFLNISGNWSISDDGTVELSKLPKLTNANLASTTIDDRTLEAFAKTTELKYLNVMSTNVTWDGVKRFKRLRPNVDVRHNAKANVKGKRPTPLGRP